MPIIGISLLTLMSSCVPTLLSTIDERTARWDEPRPVEFVTTPLLVDLIVEDQDRQEWEIAFKQADYPSLDVEMLTEHDLEYYKGIALHEAMMQAGADVILSPLYNVKNEGKSLVVKIYGFAAKYKNFRNATLNDTWFMYPNKTDVLVNPIGE